MELRLEAVSQSIRRARSWVRNRIQAAGASAETVRTAELLTSELVTNAVKYGPADGRITVTTQEGHGVLGVTVSDDSHCPPVIRDPHPTDVGGRGIRMVDTLANDWGVHMHQGDGKSVWFRLRH